MQQTGFAGVVPNRPLAESDPTPQPHPQFSILNYESLSSVYQRHPRSIFPDHKKGAVSSSVMDSLGAEEV